MVGRIEIPSELELDMLLSYLQQHAQKPIGQELRGTLETKAGHAFQSICSQCHAQPDPKQHSAHEWPAVVGRMKAHETTLGKLVPDEAKPGSSSVSCVSMRRLQSDSGRSELLQLRDQLPTQPPLARSRVGGQGTATARRC
jgi:hypothetical protein